MPEAFEPGKPKARAPRGKAAAEARARAEAEAAVQIAAEQAARLRADRVRRGRMIAAGLVLACAASGGWGAWKALDRAGVRIGSRAHAEAAQPIAAAPAAEPILAAYFPPDRDQVRRAYGDVGRIYAGEGLSGVVRRGMDCFQGLETTPSYPDLDYCLAFDAYGAALHQRLTGGAPLGPETFFGRAPQRDLAAAHLVVGKDGDPQARLLDIRRLAGHVSHEDDPAVTTVVAETSTDPEGAPVETAAAEPAPQPAPEVPAVARAAQPSAAAPPPKPRPLQTAEAAPHKPKVKAKVPDRDVQKASAKAKKAIDKGDRKAALQKARVEKAKKTKAPVIKAKAERAKPKKPAVEKARAEPRERPQKKRPIVKAVQKAEAKAVKVVKASAARVSRPVVRAVKAVARPKAQPKIQPAKTQVVKAQVAKPRPQPRSSRVERPAVTRAAIHRRDDGVVDCLRPVGRTERRICAAVRVAADDRRGRRGWRDEASPRDWDDGEGTLGGQAERMRGRSDGGW